MFEKIVVYKLVKKLLAVHGTPHRVHKSWPPSPTVSQISPVQAPSYFLKIKFNIIIETKPGSLKCFFPSRFPTKTLYAPLLSSIYSQAVPYSFFLIWTPE